jgi:acyl-CoA thioester hydrolase
MAAPTADTLGRPYGEVWAKTRAGSQKSAYVARTERPASPVTAIMPDLAHPSAGWFDGLEHVLPVRVYYEDTDFTGLVYHASYVRFFERGRSEFLRLSGVDHVAMGEIDAAFAVTRLEVDFKRAAGIDDALWVRTRFLSVRGPRIAIAQHIFRGEAVLTSALVHLACIDGRGRARRPHALLVEALGPKVENRAPEGLVNPG